MTHSNPSSTHPTLGERGVTSGHVWFDLRNAQEPCSTPTPALFLDRDGVVVEDKHYMSDPADVVLLTGAADLIRQANEASIPVVIVTNQSGVGRGYFDWVTHDSIQDRIEALLSSEGAQWDAALACPFHRDAKPPYQHPAHPFRKPQPGMLLAAAELLNLDCSRSWIVGDKSGDIEAGKNAEMMGAVHVATHPDNAEKEQMKSREHQSESFTVATCNTVSEVWSMLRY